MNDQLLAEVVFYSYPDGNNFTGWPTMNGPLKSTVTANFGARTWRGYA